MVGKKLKRAQLLVAGLGLKNGRFVVRRVLAEGGFGQIYEAEDVEESEMVAVKAEEVGCSLPLLRVELLVYRSLDEAGPDFPKTHFLNSLGYGEASGANFLVLDLVGRNLMELKKSLRSEKMSESSSLRLGKQMLRALQSLHTLGWLHRDVKPSNFCIGRRGEDARTVFVLDFGLARQYRSGNGTHKEPRDSCGFRGTVRYASVNIHAGMDQGRRDDLHSLYYILAEQLLAQLPWRRLTDKKTVWDRKADWAHHSGLPDSLLALRTHATALAFTDTPDYDALAEAMRDDLRALGVRAVDPFDWEPSVTIPTDVTPDDSLHVPLAVA